jgi:hypothetical protein
METLSGTASGVRHQTETSGSIRGSSVSGRVQGSISTRHVCTLRVAGVPVQIRLPGATNLSDGDVVTVVGLRKADGFRGLALRNESTGTVHGHAAWIGYVAAGLLLAMGIPLSLVLLGVPLVIAGGFVLWLAVRQSRALALLQSAPRVQVGT